MEPYELSPIGERTFESLRSLFALLITIGVASIGFVLTIRHYLPKVPFQSSPFLYKLSVGGFLDTILMAVLGHIVLLARISQFETPKFRTRGRIMCMLIRRKHYRTLKGCQWLTRVFYWRWCKGLSVCVARVLYSPYFWFYAAWVGFALGITSFTAAFFQG